MPIDLACSGCRKQLRVRDDLAGKHIRCPACRAVVSVPSPITEKPAVVRVKRPAPQPAIEEESVKAISVKAIRRNPSPSVRSDQEPRRTRRDAEEEAPPSSASSAVPLDELEESSSDEEAPRRRKKRRKRSSALLFTPLLSLFGIDFTPLKIIITAVVLFAAGLGGYFYFTGAEAKVRVVDVYDLDEQMHEFTTGVPETDLNLVKMFLLPKYKPKTFIVQENASGAFLLIRFKISEKTLKKLVGDDYANFVLKSKDVVLQGDGEPIHPMFMFEPVKLKEYVIRTKKLLDDDNKEEPPVEAHQIDIAPTEHNPWTHEGTLQVNPTGSSEFRGQQGMVVTYTHGRLPTKELKITWDKGSAIWFGLYAQGTPGEIFLYDWRLTCLFPKPASTKNLKLTVLGKDLTMNYP